MKGDHAADPDIIKRVASYLSQSASAQLPADVVLKAKHHILDTIAAMVSGSVMKPGQVAIEYAQQQAGRPEAMVLGSSVVTSVVNAALANGMMAHADETDDSHAPSRTHPGCAIVPAALAMAEKVGADGLSFLKAVVAGYDVGCRITPALGVEHLHNNLRSTHAIGGLFGAAAAASAVAALEESRVAYVLSYAAQQAAGTTQWVRDPEHVQKAFVFAGMPARNGVAAATMVQSGFTGVPDPFSGDRNLFEAFSSVARPELLVEELGSRHEIAYTNIKKYSVGSPIQAAVDALLILMARHGITAADVKSVAVKMSDANALATVNDRDMPDICIQYILAVTLLDGGLSFAAAHALERMKDPAVVALRKRVALVHDPALVGPGAVRHALVEVATDDGAVVSEHVTRVRGTSVNPMSTPEVEEKCRELLAPVLGEHRSQELIETIWHLEGLRNVRELRALLSVSEHN